MLPARPEAGNDIDGLGQLSHKPPQSWKNPGWAGMP